MVRIASQRIADLFALAEQEATRGDRQLPDRYVALARRIGMRYNVRLLPEYRELYCRGCSTYWVEGRTVRTRLRSGRRVRRCLVCSKERRVPLRGPRGRAPSGDWTRVPRSPAVPSERGFGPEDLDEGSEEE